MRRVNLYAEKNYPHLQQIFSGLNLLERSGLLSLRLFRHSHPLIGKLHINKPVCLIEINGVTAVIDTLDGYNFLDHESLQANIEYMDHLAGSVDFYFKRSYSSVLHGCMKNKAKIFPLGFNYQVNDKYKTIQKQLRDFSLPHIIRVLMRRADDEICIEDFEQYPDFTQSDCRILFMTRLWEPNSGNEVYNEQRRLLNINRVEAIRICRKEFGKDFLGGLYPNEAAKDYPDLVLPYSVVNKHSYLNRLKSSTICVATTGLHESTGWKFGEYVAASKCIVSEPLAYGVPGHFIPGKHYLEFTNNDSLIDAITKLKGDDGLRRRMQTDNYRYYNHYLRPDSLMLNVLHKLAANF